jgi:hypothetical protein
MTVLRIRADLMSWYSTQPAGITRVEDFSVSMLGSATKHKLGTKGAETKYLCFYCVHVLEANHHKWHRGSAMWALGKELLKIIHLVDHRPMLYDPQDFQDLTLLLFLCAYLDPRRQLLTLRNCESSNHRNQILQLPLCTPARALCMHVVFSHCVKNTYTPWKLASEMQKQCFRALKSVSRKNNKL